MHTVIPNTTSSLGAICNAESEIRYHNFNHMHDTSSNFSWRRRYVVEFVRPAKYPTSRPKRSFNSDGGLFSSYCPYTLP